ncbi:MAG TPA: plastocyanin/azurin family copper-binding protein [Acidobacteriaceae bacterium]|nr:plastocyanin/azurin family copper-binding protein [Acidobacteriaceae bacterium]
MRMKNLSGAAVVCLLLASGALSSQAQQTWQATLGAQSKDMGTQAIAFLPNELWIHVGDSIMWTSQSGDIHTVSFLLGQPLTDFTVGCPGFAMSPATFDGIHCLTAPPLVQGQTFTVKFNATGNFSLICLVHPHMTGVIHVLAKSAALPYDQAFYTKEAADQTKELLKDTDGVNSQSGQGGQGNMGNMAGMGSMDDMVSATVIPGKAQVAAGWGEMNGNGAGFQSTAVVRFLNGTIKVHAGDTVEWTVKDPATPHTVTFGTEPGNPGPPSSNVMMDADGALHATLHFVGESAHSGIIGAAPMNQLNVAVAPPAVTKFRVTFLHAGTYDYICALHDDLGMVGKVIVLP